MAITPKRSTGAVLATTFAALSLASLAALIVASAREMSLAAGLRDVARTLWGVTTLVDLYIGLFFVAAWIWVMERRPLRAALWTVAILVTGNFATAAYVFWRSWRAATLAEVFIPRPPGERRAAPAPR